ncbi:MAG: hypothetical protein QM612_09300 [Thermomonas sp.]|uniref:hypothetical protein n=1 Tax=Thermomonas sp. TaxID=1971895 RepID=UPI0039E2F1AD
MNAAMEIDTPAPRAQPAPAHATHTFKLLLKREFWEHKGGFFWAPLVAGAISLLLTLIGGGTGQFFLARHGGQTIRIDDKQMRLSEIDWGNILANASADDLRDLHEGINMMTLMSSVWPVMVFGFVVFFYFLGCLYDERKDRSVLFWKSLPVSDRDTVLSKLVMGLVVAPVIAAVLSIATMLGFGLVLSFFMAINGANPFTLYWAQLDPLRLANGLLGWLPAYALWALPTAGWLMLCSVWARSKPFLWALLLPVGAGMLVSWFGLLRMAEGGSSWFWEHIVVRSLASAWPGSHLLGYADSGHFERLGNNADALFGLDGLLAGTHLLATPTLWIGAVAGAVMIFAAIRLRRWRDDN